VIIVLKTLRKQDAIFLFISIIVFVVFQFLMSERILSSFWRLNVTIICLNVILASSLNLINGITGQFSLGHAGFMAIGAYVSAVFTMFLHTPFIISIIAGAGAAGVLGFCIGVPTLRLEGDYLAIATLGMGEIIRICILNIPQVGGASGMSGIPTETTFPWLFFCMIFTLFVLKNIINSNQGRAFLSVRENAIAAEAMGIDITKFKIFAFTIASIFAGLAGALFSHYFGIAHPSSFTFMRSFDIMTMVVLGGLGSISGSIVGAVILTFITAAMQSYPEYRMIVYALLLIVLMLYRPNGIFGDKELATLMINKWKKRGEKHGTVTENK
jgi:branched-chain amino acid transport system permease protein